MTPVHPFRATPENLGVLARELAQTLAPHQLWDDAEALAPYGRDESDAGEYPPQLAAFPETTAQVAAVMSACQRNRIPVTPCGARSGKSGGSLP
ncbi:MAG TPA: FAD-linked oxidase, partial [Myxococcaceae bacterium]|nr:FAD-linked oxidase [Myxococcaceae bacterium]